MNISRIFPFTQRKWFKDVKVLVAAALMIVASLFCALHDFSDKFEIPSIFINIVGWIGVAFFGGGSLYWLCENLVYAFKGRGVVVLTEEGLLNKDDFRGVL